MKRVKNWGRIALLLWWFSACVSIAPPHYPDFSIQIPPTPLYPAIDTNMLRIRTITKKGACIYLSNETEKACLPYCIEQVDSATHTFVMDNFYKKKRLKKRKKKRSLHPSGAWPYSSPIPDYSLFKHRLTLDFMGSDSVVCLIFHLPDTNCSPIKAVGRINYPIN